MPVGWVVISRGALAATLLAILWTVDGFGGVNAQRHSDATLALGFVAAQPNASRPGRAGVYIKASGNTASAGARAFPAGGSPVASNAPARDGDVAIRQEFEAAQAQATDAALRLFIRRHPDHPLAAKARRELRGDRPMEKSQEPERGQGAQ